MSVSKILENENTQLLIKKFDLEMPEPKYTLLIDDYEITEEGFVVLNNVQILKDEKFMRDADLPKLFDYLSDYEIKFKNLGGGKQVSTENKETT